MPNAAREYAERYAASTAGANDQPSGSSPSPHSPAMGFGLFLAGLVALVAAGIGIGMLFFGPEHDRPYDRSSPDKVLEAARDMVLDNRADRLSELLYTDDDAMRELYDRLGLVLGHLQELAEAINARFPDEVAKARQQAQEAAKEGKSVALLEQFNPMTRNSRKHRDGPPNEAEADKFNAILKAITIDPYGWLTDSQQRLSYVPIDDDRVAILWDGKPIVPPFGLVMQQDQGQWSIVLPLKSIPMLSSYLPQTPEEYSIWASLIQMVDNVVVDLTNDVKTGKLQSLDQLARATGEKAVVPIGMGMIAYNKALDERRKRQRAARKRIKAQQQARQESLQHTQPSTIDDTPKTESPDG